MLYRLLCKHALAKTDPEQVHKTVMRLIGVFKRSPLARLSSAAVGYLGGDRLRGLPTRPVPDRLGLVAGQDKNATAVLGTIAMGLVFTEVGAVTSLPQPGNDRPWLWRLPEERVFRDRMGSNNDGTDAIAERLAILRLTRRGRACVVGVNIGKNKWVETTDAPADYAVCARKLAPYSDYLVANVSSSNTPGLRDFRTIEPPRSIVRATREAADLAAGRRVPILVKVAPDLGDTDVDGVADLAIEEEIDGVVATSMTIAHSHGGEGLFGEPVRARVLEVVSRLRKRLGSDYIVIGVGGIFTANDAETMVNAGADLLGALTGFVYEGPLMPDRINRVLARK